MRERVNLPQKLRAELSSLHTTFHFPVNDDISNGLNEFVKAQKVDLLVMSPHKHEWMERFFVKSETEDMVFHSHVPLLVLPQTLVEATHTSTFQTLENYSVGK